MRTKRRETVEYLQGNFHKGCRIELLRMDDPFSPPFGAKGTVTGVDGNGTIHVNWGNGSSLGGAYDGDYAVRIDNE